MTILLFYYKKNVETFQRKGINNKYLKVGVSVHRALNSLRIFIRAWEFYQIYSKPYMLFIFECSAAKINTAATVQLNNRWYGEVFFFQVACDSREYEVSYSCLLLSYFQSKTQAIYFSIKSSELLKKSSVLIVFQIIVNQEGYSSLVCILEDFIT